MTNVALFQIIDPENGVAFNEYELTYSSPKELQGLFQEAREVWDEYLVNVQFGWNEEHEIYAYEMTYGETYQVQLNREMAAAYADDLAYEAAQMNREIAAAYADDLAYESKNLAMEG